SATPPSSADSGSCGSPCRYVCCYKPAGPTLMRTNAAGSREREGRPAWIAGHNGSSGSAGRAGKHARLRSDGFDGALWQRGLDTLLLYLDFEVVADLDDHEPIGDLGHLAEDAATGDHLITFAKAVHQVLVLFGPLLLGADQEEVEHHHHDHQH